MGSDPLDPLNTPFTTGPLPNALYINCGGNALIDGRGRLWHSDIPFLVSSNTNLGIFTGSVDTSLLGDPAVPQDVLLTERWKDGNIDYQVPVENGSYAVVLYFSENYPLGVNPDLGGTGGPGTARIFDVHVENIRLHNYNQADAALPPPGDGRGAIFTATQLVFRNVSVNDGLLNVDIVDLGPGDPPENAAIKGMLIIQQSSPGGLSAPVIRSIAALGNSLEIQVDPGLNRAAYYAGLTRLDLEQSTDLEAWSSSGAPASLVNDLVVFSPAFDGSVRFYRVGAK